MCLSYPFLKFKQETSVNWFAGVYFFNRIGWPSRTCTDLCLQSTTILALQMESCHPRIATSPFARFGKFLKF